METKSEASDRPPTYVDSDMEAAKDVLEPAVFSMAGESILVEGASSMSLYHLSRSVLSFSSKQSSAVLFERVEHEAPEKATSAEEPTTQRNRPLFHLVHPVNAAYRTDIPAYYITSIAPGMVGNIQLETSKSRLQKTEFKVMLSPNKTASNKSLFDEKAQQQLLFSIKPKWVGGRYKWTNANGGEVAFEDPKDGQHKLVVTAHLQRGMRDALLAVWALRLWHDTAESRQAKREGKLILLRQTRSLSLLGCCCCHCPYPTDVHSSAGRPDTAGSRCFWDRSQTV